MVRYRQEQPYRHTSKSGTILRKRYRPAVHGFEDIVVCHGDNLRLEIEILNKEGPTSEFCMAGPFLHITWNVSFLPLLATTLLYMQ